MLKLFKRKKTPKVELIFCGILMKSSYINDNIKTLYISHFNICNTIRRALRIKKMLICVKERIQFHATTQNTD